MSGYKTWVSETSQKGLPSDTSKPKEQNYRSRPSVPDGYREQALPITPKHEERREKHQPQPDEPSRRPVYNAPPESGKGPDEKSLHKDRVRTKSQPGEEYGHPFIDDGPAGIKKRRTQGPTAAMKGPPFPGSSRQRKQRGQAKLYYKRYYRRKRGRIRLRMKKWNRRWHNTGRYKRDRKRRRLYPRRFERKPGGGYATVKQRSKDWRADQPKDKKTAQVLLEPILILDWTVGQEGFLLEVCPETGLVTYELDGYPRTVPFDEFIDRIVVPDEEDADLLFEYLDKIFEYNTLDQSVENVRLAYHARQRPKKRQRRRKGLEKFRSKQRYKQNRMRNVLRARKRYKKNKKLPQFKKQQKIRRKHPERFKRRLGGVLVAPEIAFVIGGTRDLGYVHEVSGMSGMVTFYRFRPGENDASLESMPVDLFVASVVFLSDQDMEAAFELIEVEIGEVVWGELTPEALRASSELMDVDCDSPEFKKLCQKLVGKSELEAMTPDELLDIDSKLVNKVVYDSPFPHEHDEDESDPAERYMIDPQDDDYIYGQVNLPGDYEHLVGKVAARWVGASFYYDKPDTGATPKENWYDRGQGWSKKKKEQEDRKPTLEKTYPYGFVDNNPGSAKVIPEGHDFANKTQWQLKRAFRFNWKGLGPIKDLLFKLVKDPLWKRYQQGWASNQAILDWFERHGTSLTEQQWEGLLDQLGQVRIAARILDITGATGQGIHDRALGLKPKLKRVDAQHAMWTYHVPASKGGSYTVKVKAPRKGNIKNVAKLDVFVSCSCPFWQWQGPEHWASERGYLYGKPRGTASKPGVKDPNGEHGACKHVLAVLGLLKKFGPISPRWSKRGATDVDFRYLADKLAKGEARVLSARRVASRYLGRVIQQARRK